MQPAAPGGPARRLSIAPMPVDMTSAAKCHEPAQIVGIGACAQWRFVVAFEPTGAAALAAPVTIAPKR